MLNVIQQDRVLLDFVHNRSGVSEIQSIYFDVGLINLRICAIEGVFTGVALKVFAK